MNPPSPAGSNGSGRTPFGQFLPGNKYGKGNPLARKAQQLRVALSRAATVADVKAIARKMIDWQKTATRRREARLGSAVGSGGRVGRLNDWKT